MALNETQRQNLSKLDVMEGTGIFTNNTKVDSVTEPTVIIGLGGIGCRTLNELKHQIKRRVNAQNNSIRLLAIDSDDDDLALYGNLTAGEKLSLYEPTIPNMTSRRETIPSHILNWLNEGYIPQLKGKGCGGVRQNGRFILSVPAVYQKVRNELYTVIMSAKAAAQGNRIHIIFVAGISGGTGSGTFIDMAYLVQDILKTDVGQASRESYNMSAYLYMPDVQFRNGADVEALKSNGYAALKELDYFYNLKKVNGVYEWPFAEGALKNSTSNIYDFCTLVTGYDATGSVANKREDKAIDVTVESLMAIITNTEMVDEKGNPMQVLSSFLDNRERNVGQWLMKDETTPKLFPRSANYKYSVIGYGSAKIPVDAIMSYIALKMYENMLDEYHNMNSLTAEYISRVMTDARIGDMDTIISAVKEVAQCTYSPNALPSGGDIHGVRGTYRAWRDRAIEHYTTYKNTQPFSKAIDTVTANIIKAFDTKLNTTFGERGPYFVVKSITASFAADGVDGILKKIDALIKSMGNEYNDRMQKCNTVGRLSDILDNAAGNVPAIFGIVRQEDRDDYLKVARATIEKFTVEMEILARMGDKLVEVRNFLIDSNNKVFDVYTNVLDHIKDILAKNSDLVVKSSRTTKAGGGELYSLDVVNLDTAQENGRRLKSCLDSFLTPEFLAKFKDAFEELLRAPENRPAFTDTTDKFNATHLIQKLFDELLGKFYQEAVERFLIAYYSDSEDMDNIQKLDAVMNNDDDRQDALELAVNEICKILKNSAKPLCQIIAGDLKSFAVPKRYICCPTILYNIFKKVVPQHWKENIDICKRDNAFSIDVVTSHIGIPLAKIHGINEADIAYDTLITNNAKGVHLDEGRKSDFTMLPAPFVYEAWGLVEGEHKCSVELNNIAAVQSLRQKLNDYGLVIYNNDEKEVQVTGYFETEISESILADFLVNVNYTFSPAMKNADYIKKFLETKEISTIDISVKTEEEGLPSTLENVNIILRKNIVLYRKLVAFIKKYEQLNDILEANKQAGKDEFEFNNNVTEFTNLIKTDIITYDSASRCWNYFDGTLVKPLYDFSRKGNFERMYNVYFAFAEYVSKLDDNLKKGLEELSNNQQINFTMPAEIEVEINKLFAPGTPNTMKYLLDRELCRKNVNDGVAMLIPEFSIPLPKHNDNFEALMKFYNAFKENFN